MASEWALYSRTWPVNVGRGGWRGLWDHFIAVMRGRSYTQSRGEVRFSVYWQGPDAFLDDLNVTYEPKP